MISITNSKFPSVVVNENSLLGVPLLPRLFDVKLAGTQDEDQLRLDRRQLLTDAIPLA